MHSRPLLAAPFCPGGFSICLHPHLFRRGIFCQLWALPRPYLVANSLAYRKIYLLLQAHFLKHQLVINLDN